MNNFCRTIGLAFLLVGVLVVSSYGQQYTVKGTITASGVPVRYAIVTFTDGYHPSTQYTAETDSTGSFNIGSITGVKSSPRQPASFQLEQNYPNPFASKTAISYNLDRKSDVQVTIYDVLGRVVKRYSLGYQDAGVHGIIWDGRNVLDRRVAPGVYFYRLQARGRSEVRKMLFGIGAPNAPVSLSGLLPSRTTESGISKTASPQSEPFTVSIANTDSTFPLVVSGPLYPAQEYVRIGSDTVLALAAHKLNPAIVYADSTAQLIEGFGGANVLIFYQGMTASQIQTAFDSTSGDIGLTIMRVSIPPDSTLFNQDVQGAKLAESYGAKVIATPWTPPAWMKSNDSLNGGSIDTSAFAAFAAHLKAFADTMANNGAPVYAVSVQNEPDAGVGYQSCYWSPTDFLDFMKSYAPGAGVPVFMPESESFNHTFSDPTLNDPVASANTAFVGGHLYGDVDSRGDVSSSVQYPLALQKGKQLWMTEYLIDTPNPTAKNPISSVDTGWVGAMATAKTISDCMDYNMSAYVTWELPRYYSMIGDGNYGTVPGKVMKKGYVMSQFARFIRPGYRRVYSTYSPQPYVYVTGYKGNGKTVLVVLNMNSNSALQPFTLNNSSVTSFTPYVTSSAKSCEQESNVTVTGGKFTVTLDASSVTTFVSN